MAERLLIVGGTGFIGRNLALAAVMNGFDTIVLSIKIPTNERMVEGVEYLQANITNSIQIQNKLSTTKFDYVVNLSGYIDHYSFLEGGRQVIDTHFGGLQNLLQVLNWSSLKLFVQIGSSDEYGNLPAPQVEEMRESPISPYSLGKVASTQLLQMLHRTEGLPIVVLRLFLVYGPGQDNKRFLPQVINGCLSNAHFPASAGEQLRDFCYVDDVARGILMTLTNDKVNGEIINLASGKAISIRKVVQLVQKNIGQGTPDFGVVPYRIGENMALYADISKANKILGWEPTVSIKEGIERTVGYYQKMIL